jgi:hypothetical protein
MNTFFTLTRANALTCRWVVAEAPRTTLACIWTMREAAASNAVGSLASETGRLPQCA